MSNLTEEGVMTSEAKKIALLHKINLLADSVDERWHSLTTGQADKLEQQIEATWALVCRRSK